MNHALEVWGVIVVALIAANLPFVNERLFIVGPRRAPKALAWRLLELMLMLGLVLANAGQIEAARTALETALTIDPFLHQADNALRLLDAAAGGGVYPNP